MGSRQPERCWRNSASDRGWKCLEVGAGGGSLVEWMAARGAYVTAIDIDTRFVDHLASDAITVRRTDIREDELPQSEFDLVHAAPRP